MVLEQELENNYSPIRHKNHVSINVVATRTGLFMVALGACRKTNLNWYELKGAWDEFI